MDNFGKGDGIIGCKFVGFNDNGIFSDESWCQFVGDKKEWEVLWQDFGGYFQCVFKDKDIFFWVIVLYDFIFVMVCLFCYIVEIVCGECNFYCCQLLDFVVFSDNQFGDFVGMLVDIGGNFVQLVCMFNGWQCFLVGLGVFGGVNCQLCFFGSFVWDL